MAKKIIIETPARLHFGVINPFNKESRLYLSAGIAIDQPRNIISIYPDNSLRIEGCRGDEVYSRIKQVIDELDLKNGHVIIEKCIPKHIGLGSSTQLLLGVLHGLLLSNDINTNIVELAGRIGIGKISGVGTYVYLHGGFVVDMGKSEEAEFPKLYMRLEFPREWRFIVAIPPGMGLDEESERKVFRTSRKIPSELVWRASHSLFIELIPAIMEKNFGKFAKALAELQETVGSMFSDYQGGVFTRYSTSIVEYMRELGVKGIGQSSWGPTIYGILDNHEKALDVLNKVKNKFPDINAFITTPRNKGVDIRIVVD